MAHDHDSIKAATRANAVSALATDVDTSAQPVSSCPSTTQNGLNSIMVRDHGFSTGYGCRY